MTEYPIPNNSELNKEYNITFFDTAVLANACKTTVLISLDRHEDLCMKYKKEDRDYFKEIRSFLFDGGFSTRQNVV